MRMGGNFIDEFLALLTDFYEISNDKNEATKNTISELRQLAPNISDLTHDQARHLMHDNLKHNQFRIAMFNYMNAIFERNIHSLLKFSIINNEDIKKRYLEKFIEIESERIQQGQKAIRNATFELMNSEEKLKIYLSFFKEVIGTLPPLLNYQHFFNIPDKAMWKEKSLKFDFNEIRARRNLLTHRGIHFDKDYADTVTRSVTTSKNSVNPQSRIEYFFKNNLFTFPKFNGQLTENLYSLVNERTQIPVAVTYNYFIFSFCCLLRIYITAWSFAANSDELIISASHDLMNFGFKVKTKRLTQLAITIIEDYLDNFGKEKSQDYLKANYILGWRDVHNSLMKSKKKIKTPSSYETEFKEYFRSKIDEPLYKVLIDVCDNNLEDAIRNLSECRGLPEDSFSWFLFNDLRSMDGFKEAHQKASTY